MENPELALWRAVILQALEDSVISMNLSGNVLSANKRIRVKEEALFFFSGDSPMLTPVCDLAGIHPSRVIEAAKSYTPSLGKNRGIRS